MVAGLGRSSLSYRSNPGCCNVMEGSVLDSTAIRGPGMGQVGPADRPLGEGIAGGLEGLSQCGGPIGVAGFCAGVQCGSPVAFLAQEGVEVEVGSCSGPPEAGTFRRET